MITGAEILAKHGQTIREVCEAKIERMPEGAKEIYKAAPDLLTACIAAERLIRDGGTVPIKGQTWEALHAAIKKAVPRFPFDAAGERNDLKSNQGETK